MHPPVDAKDDLSWRKEAKGLLTEHEIGIKATVPLRYRTNKNKQMSKDKQSVSF